MSQILERTLDRGEDEKKSARAVPTVYMAPKNESTDQARRQNSARRVVNPCAKARVRFGT